MDLISQVVLLGGVTDRTTLVNLRGTAEVRRALRDGILVRDGRGRYALPTAQPNLRTASSTVGVLSHRSAAAYWGWAQKTPDGLAEVTFPRTRRVHQSLRRVLIPHWSDLPPDDVVKEVVTSMRRTLVDCLRNLPFDDALSIANSALRSGDITKAELLELARSTRGRGRTRIIGVAEAATSKPANAFESVLLAQALMIPGLNAEAQLEVAVSDTLTLHPDVGDASLRVLFEAEGFESHGSSAALTRDCRRYNTFVAGGWLVYRFSWSLVMFDPSYVQEILLAAVARARQHANVARAA